MWLETSLITVSLRALGVLQSNLEPSPLKVCVLLSANNYILFIAMKPSQRVVLHDLDALGMSLFLKKCSLVNLLHKLNIYVFSSRFKEFKNSKNDISSFSFKSFKD
jgi:hypothetical protein